MKAIVTRSVTGLFCLFVVLIPVALAQGPDWYCTGPYSLCSTIACQPATGSCPDVPTLNYVAIDLDQTQMVTVCDYGEPEDCSLNRTGERMHIYILVE